jgi:hypothetical protein
MLRGRATVLVLALVASASSSSMAACHKSAEQEAEEAKKAAADKEAKEAKAFRELEGGNDREAARRLVESQEADEKAARAAGDVRDAVTRERERLRQVLAKEIGWVDRRVEDMERVSLSMEGAERLEKERDVVAARAWRARLQQDFEALEHPPPGTSWPALKARIERDLDEDRPPSIPHSYEKSYGI